MPVDRERERDLAPVSPARLGAALVLLLTLGVAGAAATQLGGPQAFTNDGPSMEPTLGNGDRFLIERYGLWLGFLPLAHWGEPAQGDVVVVASARDQVLIVKRVIAVGGQHVVVDQAGVSVDGERVAEEAGPCAEFPELRIGTLGSYQPLPDESCTVYEETLGDSRHFVLDTGYGLRPAEMVVPEGHVFVMGDHRDRSNDSTNPVLGAVPVENVIGRMMGVYWRDGS